jgi:hypothetical protein
MLLLPTAQCCLNLFRNCSAWFFRSDGFKTTIWPTSNCLNIRKFQNWSRLEERIGWKHEKNEKGYRKEEDDLQRQRLTPLEAALCCREQKHVATTRVMLLKRDLTLCEEICRISEIRQTFNVFLSLSKNHLIGRIMRYSFWTGWSSSHTVYLMQFHSGHQYYWESFSLEFSSFRIQLDLDSGVYFSI